jgi:hypothetical protein
LLLCATTGAVLIVSKMTVTKENRKVSRNSGYFMYHTLKTRRQASLEKR